jgi:hypothetical protein
VLEKTPDGNGVRVRQPVGNATVVSSTTYQNIIVHIVSAVIVPPPDLKSVLGLPLVGRAPNGFTQLGAALQKVNMLDQVNTGASTTVRRSRSH